MSNSLNEIYREIKPQLKIRLNQFRSLYRKGNQQEIFQELCFCLLTPQSKAKSCWEAVLILRDSGLVHRGTHCEIAQVLRTKTRFHNQKALNLVLARDLVYNELEGDLRKLLNSTSRIEKLREQLVRTFRGMGYKEASHFIRNVGRSFDLAILDRHILKNLVKHKIIREIPKSINSMKYAEIENKMKRWSEKIDIPLAELDLLLWYLETGEIFK
ncbi:MAG: hypothetical protein APR63_12840 [Desulfuromonas sp. SDB]|nr:MAG: hypothetical protein APR63_12840 [Desulfuromonas sp. SDB]